MKTIIGVSLLYISIICIKRTMSNWTYDFSTLLVFLKLRIIWSYIGRMNQFETPRRDGQMAFCIQTRTISKMLKTNIVTFPYILKLKCIFPGSQFESLKHISGSSSLAAIDPSWHDKNGRLEQLYVRKTSK